MSLIHNVNEMDDIREPDAYKESSFCNCNHHRSQHMNNFIAGSYCRVFSCDCRSFQAREVEPEDAEALRMKQLLEDLALFPVEMEIDFYKTCVKFINGEEAYPPNILDYEEVQDD